MIDIEKIKPLIIKRLKPLKPNKIILFGSYAYGTPNENSDIDLYVVTQDNFLPQTWKDKSNIYMQYAKKIKDLQDLVPIDLIVHTKPMYDKFTKMGSMFSKKILQNGNKIL